MDPSILTNIDAMHIGDMFDLDKFKKIMKNNHVFSPSKKFDYYLLYYIKKFEKTTNKFESSDSLIEMIVEKNNKRSDPYDLNLEYIGKNIESICKFVNYLYWFNDMCNLHKQKSYLFNTACKLVDGDEQSVYYCGRGQTKYSKTRIEIMNILFGFKPVPRVSKRSSAVKVLEELPKMNIESSSPTATNNHSSKELDTASILYSLSLLQSDNRLS